MVLPLLIGGASRYLTNLAKNKIKAGATSPSSGLNVSNQQRPVAQPQPTLGPQSIKQSMNQPPVFGSTITIGGLKVPAQNRLASQMNTGYATQDTRAGIPGHIGIKNELKTLTGPANFSQAKTPASINTAESPDFQTAMQPQGGYSSTNPDVIRRVAEMQTQANSSSASQRAPTTPVPSAGMGAGVKDPAFLQRVAQDNLSKLQERYLATLTPSERERALQSQLTDYIGQANLGISGLEGQGRGIPLGLVRGQQAKLQEQANLGAQTLEAQLANEQGARVAQQNALNAQLGFEQDARTREDNLGIQNQNLQLKMLESGYTPVSPEDLQNINDPQADVLNIGGQTFLKTATGGGEIKEVGGSLVRIKPDGTAEVIYQGAQSGGGEGFSLSPGQTRYDAYGNPIASAPGSSGASAATEGERAGAGFYNRAVAAEEALDSLGGNVNNKFWQGVLPNQLQSAEYQQFRQAGEDFIKAVLRAESGASIPPDEMASYFKTYFPQPGDKPETLQQKAESRQRQIDSLKIEAGRALQGGDDIDQFLDNLDFPNAQSGALNGSKIVSVNLGNKPIQVSSAIADRLAKADAEYFRATGRHIEVSEGVRSRERQAMLYDRYKSGQGGRAAPPGKSFHETGNAIDVSGDWKAAEPYLRKYGFLNNLADDKHHFSIGEFS